MNTRSRGLGEIEFKAVFFFLGILFPLSLLAQTANNPCDGAQAFHVVVIGSSTAAGTGPSSIDSAWVWRYRAFMQNINPANQVTNLAQGGYNTYKLMPTGFIPPNGRPAPDTTKNITAGLKQNPDAIIINLPSNDAAIGVGPAEQLGNFDSIVSVANTAGVPIWVCTTQPRNFSAQKIAWQLDVRDSILARYGSMALDFWTTVANSSGTIDPNFDSGDGVHLNNAGHRVLFTRVKNANIPSALYQAPNFPDFAITGIQVENPSICGDSNQVVKVAMANFGQSLGTAQSLNFNLNTVGGPAQNQTYNLSSGLNSCTADTAIFTINTYAGGNYELSAWVAIAGDSNAVNDSFKLALNSTGHPSLTVVGDTGCSAGQFWLNAAAGPEDTIAWYDAQTGGTLLSWGSQFQTPFISSSQTYYAEAVRGDLFYSNELSTTQTSGINWNGTMFDLIPAVDMSIDSFALKSNSTGAQNVAVYYRQGSHIGFQQNANAWTYLGVSTVNIGSAGSFGTFPVPAALNLTAGDTFGIYLSMQNPNSTLAYQSIPSTIVRSNNELSIQTGSGVGNNFSATYFPRDWNGTVYYHHGFRPQGDCVSERLPVDAVLSFPSLSLGNDTIIDLNGAITLNAGSGYTSYQWSTGATGQTVNLTGQGLGQGIHFVTVMATDANGCVASDTLVVGVALLAGMDEMQANVQVFPNPVEQGWTVEVGIPGEFEFALFGSDGRKWMSNNLKLGANHFTRGDLAAGIYFYTITGSRGVLQSRSLVLR